MKFKLRTIFLSITFIAILFAFGGGCHLNIANYEIGSKYDKTPQFYFFIRNCRNFADEYYVLVNYNSEYYSNNLNQHKPNFTWQFFRWSNTELQPITPPTISLP